MRYFFDTEFLEDGKTIELISIGIVAEDECEYYAVSKDAPWASIFQEKWLVENVVPHLPMHKRNDLKPWSWGNYVEDYASGLWKSRREIQGEILAFIGDDPSPEFWAYYASYDWVVLCQLFGRMMHLPSGWPMFCRDLQQVLCDMKQRPPDQAGQEHNALADARWVKQAFEFCVLPK